MAGRLAGGLLWSVFRTLRFEHHVGSVNPFDLQGDNRFLFSVWHDSAVMAAFGGNHQNMVALTSRHRDGTFVESALQVVNVGSVRGSSGPTGGRAVLRLLGHAKSDHIVITPDGPRGPRRQMSRGIVYLASKSGNPIIPTTFAGTRTWEISGSWTSLTVPKPFSTVFLCAGQPVRIPPNLAEDDIDYFTGHLQQEMDQLQALALYKAGVQTPSSLELSYSESLDKAA